jgi:hypothetical protein
MNERFPVLRVISSVFKALAWIAGIAGAIAAVVSPFITAFSPLAELGNFLAILIGTVLNVLVLYGIAEFIMLGLAIEENTHQMREELAKRPPMERVA